MAGLINYTPTNNPQAVNQQLKPDPTPDQDQSAKDVAQDYGQGNSYDRPESMQKLVPRGDVIGQSISAQNSNNPQVTNATAQQATATGWNIDPATQTVAGQIQGLIQRGSPLMEQAKTSAQQQMAARGLQNSSLGITAGEEAVYKSALPIASQDASQYGRAAEFTSGAQNQASLANAQLGTNVSLANAGAANTAANLGAQLSSQEKLQRIQSDTQMSLADKTIAANKILQEMQSSTQLTVAEKQAATQKYVTDQNTQTQKYLQSEESLLKTALQDKDAATRMALQESANASAKDLANIQADYQTLIRTDASASQAIASAAAARQSVITDKTMSTESRAAAFNMINNQLKAALNLHGSINGVDLTGLLDTFGGNAQVVQTPAAAAPVAPAATPITTKSGVSFSSDDVNAYMAQNKFDASSAKGYMQAMQKWNTDNPTKQITLDDLGAAHGMTPAQTAAWMKANPGK